MIIDCKETFEYNKDGWKYLSETTINNILSSDENPFVVTILALKEGMGKLERDIPREYTKNSVYTFSELCIGKEMFLGHISPEDRPRTYRVPVAKILASQVRKITKEDITKNNGLSLKDIGMIGCFVKSYISKNAKALKQHIKEYMSNSVSIDGDATIAKKDNNTMLIDRFTKVYSVDFCNNGTEGIDGMGVINWAEDLIKNTETESVKYLLDFEIKRLKNEINLTETNEIDINKKKVEIIVDMCKKENIQENIIEKVCLKLSNCELNNIEDKVKSEIELISSLTPKKTTKINLTDILEKKLVVKG